MVGRCGHFGVALMSADPIGDILFAITALMALASLVVLLVVIAWLVKEWREDRRAWRSGTARLQEYRRLRQRLERLLQAISSERLSP